MKEFEAEFKALYDATYELLKKPSDPAKPNMIIYELFYESVKCFGYDVVKSAFSKHIRTPQSGKWMPSPADIVQIIEGSGQDRSFLAWSKVEKSIPTVGAYETVAFDDPIIHLVIKDMGGWITICQGQQEELKFRGNEFKTRYQSYMGKSSIPAHPPKLFGIHESENSHKMIRNKQAVVLIGNHDKAMLVLESGKNKKDLEISSPRNDGQIDAGNLKQLIEPNED